MSVTKWKVIENEKGTKELFVKTRTKVEIYIQDRGTISTTIALNARRDPISNRWRIDISELLEIANN